MNLTWNFVVLYGCESRKEKGAIKRLNVHVGSSRKKSIPRGGYQEWISALADISILGAGLGLGVDILVQLQHFSPLWEDSTKTA